MLSLSSQYLKSVKCMCFIGERVYKKEIRVYSRILINFHIFWEYLKEQALSRSGQKDERDPGKCCVPRGREWSAVPCANRVWQDGECCVPWCGSWKVLDADSGRWCCGEEAGLEGFAEGREVRKWRRFTYDQADYSHFPFAMLWTTWFSRLWLDFLKFKRTSIVLVNLFEFQKS